MGFGRGAFNRVGLPGALSHTRRAAAAVNSHSLSLDRASEQYASISDAAQTGLTPPGDFTLEGWINPSSLGSGELYCVASKGTGSNSGTSYLMRLSESAGAVKIQMYVNPGGTNYGLEWDISIGSWKHVAFLYDSTAQWDTQTLTIDGVDQGAGTVIGGTGSDVVGSVADVAKAFEVGRLRASTQHYDGLIDEVRFWSTLRTVTQIANNYQSELAGTETGLEGYWKLNNDYTDETANGNDLTASGSPTFSTSTPF